VEIQFASRASDSVRPECKPWTSFKAEQLTKATWWFAWVQRTVTDGRAHGHLTDRCQWSHA